MVILTNADGVHTTDPVEHPAVCYWSDLEANKLVANVLKHLYFIGLNVRGCFIVFTVTLIVIMTSLCLTQ